MLLTKLNTLCEEVKCSLTSKEKSVDPAPQKANPNQSLVDKGYFKEKDDTRATQKTEVPSQFARKYRKGHKKSSIN